MRLRTRRWGAWPVAVALVLAWSMPASAAPVRVWNIPLGTPVTELGDDFVMPACGTNGGPPTVFLDGFADFARCTVEAATGLREIWFSYDDITEYFYRALRSSDEIVDGSRANALFEQLVMFSLLVDGQGRVQGYRIISDPREDRAHRLNALAITQPIKAVVFGAFGWQCVNLPAAEGEMPFNGQFIKEDCKKLSNGRAVTIQSRTLLKPGQRTQRVGEGFQLNEFDVRAHIEVVNAALAR